MSDWDPAAMQPKCFDMSCPEASLPVDCTPNGCLPLLLYKAVLAGHHYLFFPQVKRTQAPSMQLCNVQRAVNLKGTPPPPP